MNEGQLAQHRELSRPQDFERAIPQNRLLGILEPDDFAVLESALERVPLSLGQVLMAANEPLTHAYFIEKGLISIVSDYDRGESSQGGEGRIEIGLVGFEGLAGVPLVLGADRSPHMGLVQGEGHALRIAAADLQIAMYRSGSLRGVLGRFVQSLIVQVGQTVHANADLNIDRRLARWILMTQDRLRTDDLPLTHSFLSLMLGVRRPGITVATQILEEKKLIKAKRGHITVVDRDGLIELVGATYGVAEAEYERLLRRV